MKSSFIKNEIVQQVEESDGDKKLVVEERRVQNGKSIRARLRAMVRPGEKPVVDLTVKKACACGNLNVVAYPGAEPWMPDPSILEQLSQNVHGVFSVEMHPRSALPTVWERDHNGKAYSGDPYGFRAYTSGPRAVIFVDDTETPESALWVLLHELAHMDLHGAPYLLSAFRRMTAPDYFSGDEAHERDPEEQMANAVATEWLNRLGYEGSYPRPWWRARVQESSTKLASFFRR
jgi:hypothetical protein